MNQQCEGENHIPMGQLCSRFSRRCAIRVALCLGLNYDSTRFTPISDCSFLFGTGPRDENQLLKELSLLELSRPDLLWLPSRHTHFVEHAVPTLVII